MTRTDRVLRAAPFVLLAAMGIGNALLVVQAARLRTEAQDLVEHCQTINAETQERIDSANARLEAIRRAAEDCIAQRRRFEAGP